MALDWDSDPLSWDSDGTQWDAGPLQESIGFGVGVTYVDSSGLRIPTSFDISTGVGYSVDYKHRIPRNISFGLSAQLTESNEILWPHNPGAPGMP